MFQHKAVVGVLFSVWFLCGMAGVSNLCLVTIWCGRRLGQMFMARQLNIKSNLTADTKSTMNQTSTMSSPPDIMNTGYHMAKTLPLIQENVNCRTWCQNSYTYYKWWVLGECSSTLYILLNFTLHDNFHNKLGELVNTLEQQTSA